jgi:hypothetical protein
MIRTKYKYIFFLLEEIKLKSLNYEFLNTICLGVQYMFQFFFSIKQMKAHSMHTLVITLYECMNTCMCALKRE